MYGCPFLSTQSEFVIFQQHKPMVQMHAWFQFQLQLIMAVQRSLRKCVCARVCVRVCDMDTAQNINFNVKK